MSIRKTAVAFASAAALLLVTASPGHAATTTYWNGNLSMDAIKQSATYATSTGGRTELGATTHNAKNTTAQYGYAYYSASGHGLAILTHGPVKNVNNWAYWTAPVYISGKVNVVGKVNH